MKTRLAGFSIRLARRAPWRVGGAEGGEPGWFLRLAGAEDRAAGAARSKGNQSQD